MTECQKCRDWKGCPGKEFFNYAEVRWCPYQNYWLIEHAEVLESGQWPTEDNRDDNITSNRSQSEAYFVKPDLALGELKERLEQTGVYGKLLVALVHTGISIDAIEGDARDALYYISGWRRKRISFNKWRWQRKRRDNATDK